MDMLQKADLVKPIKAHELKGMNRLKHEVEEDTHVPISEQKDRKLFLGGLRACTTEMHIRQHFDRFGVVTQAVVINKKSDGRPKFFGYVTFDTKDAADRALAEEDHIIAGRGITVQRVRRAYFQEVPQETSRYHHPLDPFDSMDPSDPHEDTMEPRVSRRQRPCKYGFHRHCTDLESKNRQEAGELKWEKLNLEDDNVEYNYNNKSRFSEEFANKTSGESGKDAPKMFLQAERRPNAFNGSTVFMRNMGLPLSGINKQSLRSNGRRFTPESN
uniref:RRM domain-containing protein n=1 Tax=Steinernema glaseri TaxID=37863 RepID=A0A1I7YCJ7_9BILA